ncbi:hypothetical protein L2694_09065 [Acinetobacter baumannii]|uniref:hypothetical protein n=1 Tax=Acinetobacter baumannii TaxID=470 RepID=UPI0021495600|nr:hypothetical protein [Acinetobacter baumannii]MCR0116935.1 hypothetical protein [Acinetobacter baumannii]
MNNYKIKVKDEAESKEAQELFEQLGFKWVGDYPENGDWYSHLYAENSTCCYLSPYVWGGLGDRFKELTLPQLRDLVVLKRNNFTDATHIDQDGWKWFISSDNKSYVFGAGNSQGLPRWDESSLDHVDLKPIQTAQAVLSNLDELREEYKDYHQDPALISGAEAKLAWAKGVDIQIKNVNCVNWYDLDGSKYNLDIFDHVRVVFRLKPQTIKLELELPKPFEPKDNDWVWTISGVQEGGITQMLHRDGNDYPLGAWRTEDEIKQVVEQLRKIRGAS